MLRIPRVPRLCALGYRLRCSCRRFLFFGLGLIGEQDASLLGENFHDLLLDVSELDQLRHLHLATGDLQKHPRYKFVAEVGDQFLLEFAYALFEFGELVCERVNHFSTPLWTVPAGGISASIPATEHLVCPKAKLPPLAGFWLRL